MKINDYSVRSSLIKNWVLAAPGVFSVSDLDYDLGLDGVEAKLDRTAILESFVEERILAREGTKRGFYRPCHTDLRKRDLANPEEGWI